MEYYLTITTFIIAALASLASLIMVETYKKAIIIASIILIAIINIAGLLAAIIITYI